MKSILDFAILSKGLSPKDKVKLALFALGLKPATSIYLKIDSNNLDETYFLENALRLYKIIFLRGNEKSFEEVKRIKENKIAWNLAGLWIDYDLFHTQKQKENFLKYKKLCLTDKGTKKRNTIAGKLYDYPECCIEQYSKETPQHIKSKYSTYQFYKNLHAIEKKFYLMPYTPCSLKCKRSIELQKKYSVALKKTSPSFYQHLNEANPYQTDIIIESENDILANEKSIWKQKDGHDYVVLSTRPYQSKHWFYNILSKKKYAIGTVLSATIIHHTTYADIILGKEK